MDWGGAILAGVLATLFSAVYGGGGASYVIGMVVFAVVLTGAHEMRRS